MPTYRITAPDGKVFRVTGDGTKEEALAEIQARYSSQQPKFDRDAFMQEEAKRYAPTQGMSGLGKFLGGAGKAFSDLGVGAKQLGVDAGNAVGLGHIMPQTFGDQAVQGMRDEEAERRQRDAPLMDTGAGMAGNITGNIAAAAPAMFIPGANTVAGAALTGGAMGLAQPTLSGGERLQNTTVGAGLGATGQWAGGKMVNWADDALSSRAAAAATQKTQNAVRDQTIRDGLGAGFVVPPSTTNPSAMNTALESIAGKAATQSAASTKNQAVTNQLIRQDLGMAADEPLTPDTLRAVRQRAGQTYEAVKRSGRVTADNQYFQELIDLLDENQAMRQSFPDAAKVDNSVSDLANSLARNDFDAEGAVEYVKRLRSDAKSNFKAAAVAGDPSKRQLGQAQWDAAGTLEGMLERHLATIGQAELAQQFRAARTMVAKSHSAEAALNEGTGNIQANRLVQQLRKGQPLSGGFETIAKFASAAPKAMTEPTQSGGVSALSAALAGGGIGLGAPQLLAVPAARWAARKGILTPAMQRKIALSNYQPGRAGTSVLRGTRGLGQIASPLATSAYLSEQ